MSRRSTLFALIAVGVATALIAPTWAKAAEDTRPNILWLVAEDMSPDMACYGDPYAITPNLDRLAAQGVRYTRAFSVSGVCAPSRSAIITGMYPTTIGSHHMRSSAVPPAYVKCFTEYLRAAGYYCTNNAKTDYNFGSVNAAPLGAWDESSYRAHWRGRAEGQPFFAVFNLGVTHESQIRVPDETFQTRIKDLRPEDRHDPAKANIPPYYPDTPVVRNDWARYHDLITAMDLQVAGFLAQLEEDGLAGNTIVFFYGDHGRGLPRAKRWVYDSGILFPLIIRWPGTLEPNTVDGQLVSFIDFGPTLLSIAGVNPPAYMQGRAFLGQYTAPEPQYIFAARDRMDETYDIIRAVRDRRYKYIRNFQPEKTYAQHIDYMDEMPTMKEWRRLAAEGKLKGPQKLFFAPTKPVEELYDTDADPHEINNLASDPKLDSVRSKMSAILEQWMKDTGDLGLLPEPELLERMRPGGEWQITQAPVVIPPGGRFEKSVQIAITCPTEGSTIAYTTEEGRRAHWNLYTTPITLGESATLRIKAGRLGYKDSEEQQHEFRIE